MYILKCSNDSNYTGLTKYLEKRFSQHQAGEGANHTLTRLLVESIFFERMKLLLYSTPKLSISSGVIEGGKKPFFIFWITKSPVFCAFARLENPIFPCIAGMLT